MIPSVKIDELKIPAVVPSSFMCFDVVIEDRPVCPSALEVLGQELVKQIHFFGLNTLTRI